MTQIRKEFLRGGVSGLAALCLAGIAHAQREVAPPVALISAKDLQISSTFSIGETLQLANPKNQSWLNGRVFGQRHSSPEFQLGSIRINRPAKTGQVGFNSTWLVGDIADQIHQVDVLSGLTGEGRYRNIGELYATYGIPGGKGTVQAGKFFTPFGSERIEPWKNSFISYSNLFGILPRYHAGVGVSDYLVGGGVHASLFGVNSLYNTANRGIRDDDHRLDWIGRIDYSKMLGEMRNLTGSLTYGSGQEKLGNATEDVALWDVALRYASEFAGFRLASSSSLGAEMVRAEFKNGTTRTETGFALTYGQPLNNLGYLNARYDTLEQKIGSNKDRRSAITLGLDRSLGENLLWRSELRHDFASQPTYFGGSGLANKKTQDTLSTGLYINVPGLGTDESGKVGENSLGLKVSGGLSALYQTEFGKYPAASGNLDGRFLNSVYGAPTISFAELNIGKPAQPGRLGFQSSWIAGDNADAMHDINGNGEITGEGRYKNVGQLFLDYNFPCGAYGQFGKFYSPFGGERPQTWDNDFISYTNLNDLLPRYHKGFGVTGWQTPVKGLKAGGYLTHALYNNERVGVTDDNDRPAYIGQLDYKVNDNLWLRTVNGFSSENTPGGNARTYLNNTLFRYDLSAGSRVNGEYAYAKADVAGSVRSSGYALSYTRPFEGIGTGHIRYDYAEGKFGTIKDHVSSVTLGLDRPLFGTFTGRAELRFDNATDARYSSGNGQSKSQTTLSLGVNTTFGR